MRRSRPGRPARSPRSVPRALPTTRTCAACCWSASARAPQDFAGRRRCSPGRVQDRTTVATTIPAARPGRRPGAVRGRCRARLLRFPLALHLRARAGRAVVLAELADGDQEPYAGRPAWVGRGWPARGAGDRPLEPEEPGWLADQAVDIGGSAGLDVRVWDEKELADGGFGGILGVGQASVSPPRLVRIDYRRPPAPQGRQRAPRPLSWSARASPSTPAGCRSSPARRWST